LSQTKTEDIIYAGISKSMYAGSVLTLDGEYKLLKLACSPIHVGDVTAWATE